MEPAIRNLRIETLKGQVELFRLQCLFLDKSLVYAATAEQKQAIARRRHQRMQRRYAAQLMLALLERLERTQETR